MTDKTELYKLVDTLPDGCIEVVHKFLKFVIKEQDDNFLQILANALEDDEPLTKEDLVAIAEAKEDVKAGRITPWHDLKKELGL